MNENLELLNYIYQNARMGIIAIDNLKDHIADIKLKDYIIEQYKDYESVCNEAINYFIKLGHKETDLNTMIKVNTYIMVNMKAMMDNSPSNIAKMMIEGSNKGIIEITSNLNKYANCDEKVKALANKLLKIEQKNLESLKKFL